MSAYGAVAANAYTAHGSFAKADPSAVAWVKTGAFALTTQTALWVEINGEAHYFAASTAITMPGGPVAGTDYAIWALANNTLQATDNHTTAPATGARKVGGFHYAPGGNAAAQAGGDSTPAINSYSLWDLKWRPACPDPRGMALVAGGFWADIYLTGVDAITTGSSKHGATIADGSSPPKVPLTFGGDGTATYGSLTWFEVQELAAALGKSCMTQPQFMAAAYGTTEGTSIGADPGTTGLAAAYTSKWGVMQSTGVMWTWGKERSGPYGAAAWSATTESRGQEYNAPNACLLGGYWVDAALAGSRASRWFSAASLSTGSFGSRLACDHLQLV